jgi:hypothetical protein
MADHRKRPRDPVQLGKLIGDILTGQVEDKEPEGKAKDPVAVERGRKGGVKGGKARAAKLSPGERQASARKAIKARWSR